MTDAIRDVVCAIIKKNTAFLAAQRAAGQSNAHLWEFPGGKIRPGEQPQQALIREISEELGITVSVGKQLTPVIHHYSDKSIVLIPFICAIADGTPQSLEHAQILFVDPEKALQLSWSPADIPILHEYIGKCLLNA